MSVETPLATLATLTAVATLEGVTLLVNSLSLTTTPLLERVAFLQGLFGLENGMIRSTLEGLLEIVEIERLLWVPLILVGALVLARGVTWWSHRQIEASERLETSSFSRAVMAEIYAPLSLSIGLAGLYLSAELVGVTEPYPVVSKILSTVFVLVWARAAVRIGARWIEYLNQTGVEYEFAPMFKNLWTIGVVVGSLLVLLSIWELELTPFLASAGVLGIIIGFAAQDAISNLIGGVALYFDNTYKIGDVIHVDGDMRGTVTDVGIRSTTVLTPDNVLVTVPNSVLNSTQVVNETSPQRHIRLRIPISAAYGSDYAEVERLVLEACEDAPLIREKPRPRVLFDQFGDSALLFELQAFISHPLTKKRAIDQVNRRVYDAFDDAEIKIPFPQRELSYLDDQDDAEHHFDERTGLESESKPAGPDSLEQAAAESDSLEQDVSERDSSGDGDR
ncbi:mechanosensitive ion channel family protein [Halobacteria archaeon AArc-curdl1]|uniref:Mechanosensitive ion channel family protein n=1 Tax=Natronosalvus hydrolyticus TaxID=2979988 RepID=A0AAP3E6D8_9EURY|nr:mechanosensitive ion channel family protein [Halobacteria archaeon AArc-curdl1]